MPALSSISEKITLNGRRPSLPPGLRLYAIGDIHGRLDLLNEMLLLTEADAADHQAEKVQYVFLGDYIDRGTWSRQTIDRLIEHAAQRDCIFLKGNHELIALNSLSDPTMIEQWLRLGGTETLLSYDVAPELVANGKQAVAIQSAFHSALPQAHFRFFRCLRNSFSCGDFFFVHAGVKPNVELDQQKESDLLWIRGEFLSSTGDFGKIVVHGHTPTLDIEIRPNRINIDTGAFATGRLSCLAIEGETLSMVQTGAKQPA